MKTIKKILIAVVVIVILALIGGMAGGNSSSSSSSSSSDSSASASASQAAVAQKYELSYDDLGEYGRVVVLNANTDMPVEKHLYKIPEGKYKVTTTNEKLTTFYIVKDEIGTEEGNEQYPEILQYVDGGTGLLLTAGSNDFNGNAKKEITITIASDESIQLPTGTDSVIVEEILN